MSGNPGPGGGLPGRVGRSSAVRRAWFDLDRPYFHWDEPVTGRLQFEAGTFRQRVSEVVVELSRTDSWWGSGELGGRFTRTMDQDVEPRGRLEIPFQVQPSPEHGCRPSVYLQAGIGLSPDLRGVGCTRHMRIYPPARFVDLANVLGELAGVPPAMWDQGPVKGSLQVHLKPVAAPGGRRMRLALHWSSRTDWSLAELRVSVWPPRGRSVLLSSPVPAQHRFPLDLREDDPALSRRSLAAALQRCRPLLDPHGALPIPAAAPDADPETLPTPSAGGPAGREGP